jgi:hypothetical protein
MSNTSPKKYRRKEYAANIMGVCHTKMDLQLNIHSSLPGTSDPVFFRTWPGWRDTARVCSRRVVVASASGAGKSGRLPMTESKVICVAARRMPHTDIDREMNQNAGASQYAVSTEGQDKEAVTMAVRTAPYIKCVG